MSAAHCWVVLTSLSVCLSSLWASPLLLFSAKDQFEKERHEVVHPSKGERSYSAVPLFLSLFTRPRSASVPADERLPCGGRGGLVVAFPG